MLKIRLLSLPYITSEKPETEKASDEVYLDVEHYMELDEKSSHFLQQMQGCELKQIMRNFNRASLLFSNRDDT